MSSRAFTPVVRYSERPDPSVSDLRKRTWMRPHAPRRAPMLASTRNLENEPDFVRGLAFRCNRMQPHATPCNPMQPNVPFCKTNPPRRRSDASGCSKSLTTGVGRARFVENEPTALPHAGAERSPAPERFVQPGATACNAMQPGATGWNVVQNEPTARSWRAFKRVAGSRCPARRTSPWL